MELYNCFPVPVGYILVHSRFDAEVKAIFFPSLTGYDSGWISAHGRPVGKVSGNDASSRYETILADRQTRSYNTTNTNQCIFTDFHIASQDNTRCEVYEIADATIMVNGYGGIDDNMIAYR